MMGARRRKAAKNGQDEFLQMLLVTKEETPGFGRAKTTFSATRLEESR
jgi:hypothetical protein